jgi:formate--tetrahydrofolate ligase
VITTTIRALKYHGGADLKTLTEPNVEALKKGIPNLEKHLENIKQFHIVPVIAVNKFVSDTDEEIAAIQEFAKKNNVRFAITEVWSKGGKGALDLAKRVIEIVESGESNFTPLYNWNSGVKEKIETIATKIYGASQVEYSSKALKNLKTIADLGLEGLPICMAKTQKSLSDNPKLLGRPKGFTIMIREIEIAAGAGFLIPITGDMMRMPGLPAHPASENISIDNEGTISGLF